MDFEVFSKQNPPMYALRSDIFQRLHSLDKVASFCTFPLDKGVAALLWTEYKVILKETYSFKEVKESMQGGQHDFRMESFEYLC